MAKTEIKTSSGADIMLNTQEIKNISSGNLPDKLSGTLSKKDHEKYTIKLTAKGCSATRNFKLNVLPDAQSSLDKILKKNMKGKELLCPDDQPIQIGYRAPELSAAEICSITAGAQVKPHLLLK